MMLDRQLGVQLLLWMGQRVPLPASFEVMNAFREAEVTNRVDSPGDGFQLKFALGKNKQGEYSLLQSGLLDFDERVVIGVRIGATVEVLIDGVIENHQVSPGQQPGASTLTVSGHDVSSILNREEEDQDYGRQSDSTIVKQILQDYMPQGIVQILNIKETTAAPNDTERIPWQHETDLEFIQRLARRNGFVFYIEPVTMGVNQAYWGPENREGLPQPALSYDLGPSTNVRTLNMTNDALAALGTSGSFMEPLARTSIPIPNLPSLRVPPLTSSTASARRTQRLRCTANRTAEEAATMSAAAISTALEPVGANGELDTVRYGSVLRPRRKVGVRGVSRSYSGDYFVRSVTHKIERGSYTQNFTLSREGTGALFPKVRTS